MLPFFSALAKNVLGGFATSSVPAFPSNCAAAVRGSEVDYHCVTTIDKAHHLRIFALNYSCSIGVLTIHELHTYLCQSLLSTDIPSIEDNETIFYSRLRRNFGPTHATGSASPSLSGTHYGREHLCGAEGEIAVPQLNKRPERAEPEDCHSAAAGSSGTPNIRTSMTRSARLKEKRCRDSHPVMLPTPQGR